MDIVGLGLALITCVVWGTAAYFDKMAINRMGGGKTAILGGISWIPVVMMVLMIFVFHKKFGLDGEGMKWFFLSQLAWASAAVLYYLVLSKMELGTGAVITALYPIVSVMLGILFLGEKMTILKMAGVAMGMGAIILLSI
jgi:drug/metabolite transporter (DMT)-like permease